MADGRAIGVGYVRLMAAYNAEMNRRFVAAAQRLTDAQRRSERGAFWGSIHRTFNHILWADRVFMSRLTGAEPPPGTRAESDRYPERFDDLVELRFRTDDEILGWSETVTDDWLAAPTAWLRGTDREFWTARWIQVMHMFNHQTHHRGQIHALLTGFGEDTRETDLWVVAPRLPALVPSSD